MSRLVPIHPTHIFSVDVGCLCITNVQPQFLEINTYIHTYTHRKCTSTVLMLIFPLFTVLFVHEHQIEKGHSGKKKKKTCTVMSFLVFVGIHLVGVIVKVPAILSSTRAEELASGPAASLDQGGDTTQSDACTLS